MTQRREIEGRLVLFEDLSGILGAMRSFALAELHRVTRREEAQQQVVHSLTDTLQDMVAFLPPPPQANVCNDIWILFGSVRGFCGSFNEDVAHEWQRANGEERPTIAVGERLVSMMPAHASLISVRGADGGLDAAMAIDRILAAIRKTWNLSGGQSGIVACLRDEDGARTQRLVPLPVSQDEKRFLPLMNEPPARVALGVTEHFLFHILLALQLRSIRVENRMRLMQMENALQHLEHGSEDLMRQRNRMRQEEIIEEIELMARERTGMH